MADSRTYEIQLVETLRSIGRALGVAGLSSSGSSSSASSSISSNELIVAINGIISRLETNKSYLDILLERLEYDQDNDAFHVKTNFYADGFVSAGGVGSGGGGGGDATLADVWRSLTNDPLLTPEDIDDTTPINALHIPLGNGLEIDANGNIYVTSLGSVTSVAGVSPVNGDIPAASLVSALGLSSALKWRGVTTTDIVTDPTSNPIVIDGDPYTATAGDVVVLTGTSQEYMWNGTRWNAIGDESSYALKTVSITGTGYLTGGGTLEQSSTIDIADNVKSLIDNAVPNTRTVNGHALSADVTVTKGDIGLGNVDNIAAADYFTVMAMDGNDLSLTIGGTNKKLTVGYATIAVKTRFTPTESGATQIEPLLDWFVPETYTEGSDSKVRLRLNPKYAGMYADGFVSAGGAGSGGGGGGAGLAEVWQSLQNAASPVEFATNLKIAQAHLPSLSASGGLTASYGGTTLADSLSIGIASGYKLPTTTEWNNKADVSSLSAYALTSSLGSMAYASTGSYVPRSSTVSDYGVYQDSEFGFSEWIPTSPGIPSGSYYGTSLNFKDPLTTWFFRLMFDTDGRIYHYHGINTRTLTNIGALAYLSDLSNYLPLSAGSGKALTGDLYLGSHAISGATNIDSLLYFDTINSRVGIGTSAPAYALDVVGDLCVNRNNHVSSNTTFRINATDNNVYFYLTDHDDASVNLRMFLSGTERFTILNSGNVGIGTTNPATTVSINKTGTLGSNITGSAGLSIGGNNDDAIYFGWAPGSSGAMGYGWIQSTYGPYTTNQSKNLCIQPIGGSVIIGGTSPTSGVSAKLYVSGVIHSTGQILSNSGFSVTGDSGDGTYGISLYRDISYTRSFGIWMGRTSFGGTCGAVSGEWATYFTMSNNATRGWIFQAYSSSSSITQAASISAGGVIWAATGIYSDGYVTAGAAASSSDAKLKANIRDLDDPMWLIKQLRPRQWEWNSYSTVQGHALGFVAQEVEPFMPFSVGAIADKHFGTHKTLGYDMFHALWCAGLQKHETQLEALEREVKRQGREIIDLKRENAELKARISNN